jgi:hypothetical protein
MSSSLSHLLPHPADPPDGKGLPPSFEAIDRLQFMFKKGVRKKYSIDTSHELEASNVEIKMQPRRDSLKTIAPHLYLYNISTSFSLVV